jgi:hypothetical protein
MGTPRNSPWQETGMPQLGQTNFLMTNCAPTTIPKNGIRKKSETYKAQIPKDNPAPIMQTHENKCFL